MHFKWASRVNRYSVKKEVFGKVEFFDYDHLSLNFTYSFFSGFIIQIAKINNAKILV